MNRCKFNNREFSNKLIKFVYRNLDENQALDFGKLRAAATGTEHDSERELTPLSEEEKEEFSYLISALRRDEDLLFETGRPDLLGLHYLFIRNLLLLDKDDFSPRIVTNIERHLADFPHFKEIFLKDTKFRQDFDKAYEANRISAVIECASTEEEKTRWSFIASLRKRIKALRSSPAEKNKPGNRKEKGSIYRSRY